MTTPNAKPAEQVRYVVVDKSGETWGGRFLTEAEARACKVRLLEILNEKWKPISIHRITERREVIDG